MERNLSRSVKREFYLDLLQDRIKAASATEFNLAGELILDQIQRIEVQLMN